MATVNIQWNVGTGTIDNYELFWKVDATQANKDSGFDAAAGGTLITVAGNANTHTHANAPDGSNISYCVRAKNSAGESDFASGDGTDLKADTVTTP